MRCFLFTMPAIIVFLSGMICAYLNVEKQFDSCPIFWMIGVLTGVVASLILCALENF